MNNNTNYNNNKRNNRGRNNNFDENRKAIKQPKVNPNEIKLPLYLPADLEENIVNEIFDVLSTTRFNKISVPLGTYKCLVDSDIDGDDNRVCTIGYIRNYNKENNEFTVIVFGKFLDTIKAYNDIAMELTFNKYKDSLGTITKFNIVPVYYEEESEDGTEETE